MIECELRMRVRGAEDQIVRLEPLFQALDAAAEEGADALPELRAAAIDVGGAGDFDYEELMELIHHAAAGMGYGRHSPGELVRVVQYPDEPFELMDQFARLLLMTGVDGVDFALLTEEESRGYRVTRAGLQEVGRADGWEDVVGILES